MVTASWAMGAVALACFTCSLQVGHVRAGRRVLAGRERQVVQVEDCGIIKTPLQKIVGDESGGVADLN